MRVVDVDIGTGSWIRSLYFLVARPVISGWESRMHSFFSNNLILDIIFLFLVIVSTRTWVLCEGLPSVRRFAFILPELTSTCLRQEWLRFLSNELTIGGLLQVFVGSSFDRNCGLIISWTRVNIFDWFFLAVWNFWLEDSVHSWCVVKLLALFFEIINTWSRIICPWFIIIGHISLLEEFSINLWLMELKLGMLCMISVRVWMISSWSNLIETSTSISCCSHFPCWDTRGYVIWYDSMIVVFLWFVFCKCSI